VKKSLNIFAVILLCFFIISCDLVIEYGGGGYNTGDGTTRQFFALDENNYRYRLTARRLAQNSRCDVWVENGSAVTAAKAGEIANRYAASGNGIYARMMEAFGWNTNINGAMMNTMQYADSLTDKNGKLTILLLDIKDNFNATGSYIAGYFYSYDFYDPFSAPGSNGCDMIYMDTYPSLDESYFNSAAECMAEFYETLAHEMQHLMNFTTTERYRTANQPRGSMDTWLDEGLSSAAEWVYSRIPSQRRINWYNDDVTGYIAKGDNFFVWGNYTNTDPLTILNDYSTVNLFFQWLRIHSEIGEKIYGRIMNAPHSDHQAITMQYIDGSWPTMLQAWHAANYIMHPSKEYGYMNDSYLKHIKPRYINNGSFYASLFPGEAVYSYSASEKSSPTDDVGGTVWYTGLHKDTGPNSNFFDINMVPKGGALLTFNYNPNKNGQAIYGLIFTDVFANIQPQFSSGRYAAGISSGYYRIDARDFYGRRDDGFLQPDEARSVSASINNAPQFYTQRDISGSMFILAPYHNDLFMPISGNSH